MSQLSAFSFSISSVKGSVTSVSAIILCDPSLGAYLSVLWVTDYTWFGAFIHDYDLLK